MMTAAKEKAMPTSTVSYGEFEISVRPEQNGRGAWIASVSVRRADQSIVDERPGTVQPEWLTEEEATRDGVEWARRFIDHEFNSPQSRSWVAERSNAERWFRNAEESQGQKAAT
jgi:hypothetical protein